MAFCFIHGNWRAILDSYTIFHIFLSFREFMPSVLFVALNDPRTDLAKHQYGCSTNHNRCNTSSISWTLRTIVYYHFYHCSQTRRDLPPSGRPASQPPKYDWLSADDFWWNSQLQEKFLQHNHHWTIWSSLNHWVDLYAKQEETNLFSHVPKVPTIWFQRFPVDFPL